MTFFHKNDNTFCGIPRQACNGSQELLTWKKRGNKKMEWNDDNNNNKVEDDLL